MKRIFIKLSVFNEKSMKDNLQNGKKGMVLTIRGYNNLGY